MRRRALVSPPLWSRDQDDRVDGSQSFASRTMVTALVRGSTRFAQRSSTQTIAFVSTKPDAGQRTKSIAVLIRALCRWDYV